ncbi:MAG: hypothetical protein KAS32_14750 [Candidatus Peribacteraceae bacterium]|nr:hypothetical protein [Candidatus Peribacteraceae bacterium]
MKKHEDPNTRRHKWIEYNKVFKCSMYYNFSEGSSQVVEKVKDNAKSLLALYADVILTVPLDDNLGQPLWHLLDYKKTGQWPKNSSTQFLLGKYLEEAMKVDHITTSEGISKILDEDVLEWTDDKNSWTKRILIKLSYPTLELRIKQLHYKIKLKLNSRRLNLKKKKLNK